MCSVVVANVRTAVRAQQQVESLQLRVAEKTTDIRALRRGLQLTRFTTFEVFYEVSVVFIFLDTLRSVSGLERTKRNDLGDWAECRDWNFVRKSLESAPRKAFAMETRSTHEENFAEAPPIVSLFERSRLSNFYLIPSGGDSKSRRRSKDRVMFVRSKLERRWTK